MTRLRAVTAVAALCFALSPSLADGLRVWQPNPRYFEREGKPVVLFGSGLWTIIPESDISIEEHNACYARYGANANRASLYAFCVQQGRTDLLAPWARTGPGQARDGLPKFDLTKSDERFWRRVHEYLGDCQRRGIVVLLQMFDEPFVEGGPARWAMNPFNPANDVNDIPGLPTDGSGESAFYDPDNAPLMAIEDALIRRLLDETAARYDNVIYEIGNEINMDSQVDKAAAWQQHWIDFFRRYAREHPGAKPILTNDTRESLIRAGKDGWGAINDHGLTHINFARGSIADILDGVSRRVIADFAEYGRPIFNSRPCSDPDRKRYSDIVTEEKGRAIYWSYFMSGGHVIGFRTTRESWKDGLKAERIIQGLRTFIHRVPVAETTPRPELVDGDHALCLAKPGRVYAVYLPLGGKVALKLEGASAEARFTVTRYDPRAMEFAPAGAAAPPMVEIEAPSAGEGNDWTFLIEAR